MKKYVKNHKKSVDFLFGRVYYRYRAINLTKGEQDMLTKRLNSASAYYNFFASNVNFYFAYFKMFKICSSA